MLAINKSDLLAEVRERARGLEPGTRRLILEIAERYEILDQVDAVPVVRCKGCRHFKKLHEKSMVSMCMKTDGLCTSNPDHFCSYGERRSKDGTTKD